MSINKNGNEIAVYEYDTFNQMIQSSINNSMTRNKYNGEGLRVEKEVNGEITRYLYEGDRVILEVNGDNQLAARNTIGTNLISRVVVEGGSTEKLYYLYNGHGDVTALISPQGDIAAEYTLLMPLERQRQQQETQTTHTAIPVTSMMMKVDFTTCKAECIIQL